MPSFSPRRRVGAAVATCTAAALLLTPVAAASAAIVPEPIVSSAEDAPLALTPIGTYESGVFDESAAEIVQAHGDRLFVVNAQAGAVDVLDYSDPARITPLFTIQSDGVANSVAIREDGLGVIAFQAPEKTDPGHLLFFDATAADAGTATLGRLTVGALPDMVAISADGAYAVVANEGEPADDYSSDPEGSVGVVSLPATVAAPAASALRVAEFHDFEAGGAKTLPADVRVFGPAPHGTDLPVSRNLEPEYVAIDGGTAYASLQENNAIAVIDLASAEVTAIHALGFTDHGAEDEGLDPSDRDPRDAPTFDVRTFPGLHGIYMPDGIATYRAADGEPYIVTANEGDAREWGDYVEAVRVKDLGDDGLAPLCDDSPLAARTGDEELGRLNVTIEDGLSADGSCYYELYAFGARSFSIWTTDGERVFDSGEDFERITHAAAPEFFNSNHSESNLEGRSDDKGPEPENVTVGEIGGRSYAFIGFERVGGIAVYDITEPAAAEFVTYVNNRDFSVSAEEALDGVEDEAQRAEILSGAGDLGAEGVTFIPADASPTGEPLLAVANEVSGTVTLFAVAVEQEPVAEFRVLTINDFHGRLEQNLGSGEAGAAVVSGAVAQLREENPNTLFVSAGDNIGASTFTSFIDEDNPTIDALRTAGLDLGAVGNHEFDRGFADLTDRVTPRFGGAEFSLGANVYRAGTSEPALQPYAIEEVDGVRVAFIGTVTEQTAAMVSPDGIRDIEFGSQLDAANRVAAELTAADAADVIVLLAHEGSATPECSAVATDQTAYGELIRGASPEIDAIVSGHTHQPYTCLVPVDGAPGTERPVIQAHQYGTTLGSLEISVDRESKEILSISPELIPLVVDGEAAFPADPAVEEIVAAAQANADEQGSVQVGRISADITRGGTPDSEDRGVESTLGNLVADMQLWATSNPAYAGAPAQIALMNPGGVRADLRYGQDGTVTYRDAASVQPFANTLVTMTLTGAQLKQVLEEQWQPEGASRPKLHLGISEGFSYEYDEAAGRGERIVSMSLNGTEIAPEETFTVVANSFLAAGGDNFVTLAEGVDRADTGQIDLAASVAYFEQHGVVDPAPLGRAVPAGTEPVDPVDPVTPVVPAEPAAPATGNGDAVLGNTGGEFPIGLGVLAGVLLLAGGGLVAARRMRAREH